MRFKPTSSPQAEGDLTPMIDMTFQLIAFFMVLVNFTEAEQNERIRLPSSQLARPPDAAFENPISLQLTREGTVLFAGNEVTIAGLKPYLITEAQFLRHKNQSPAEATVIIRADADTATGRVQELIQLCQDTGFERFALRAREELE